MCPPPQLTHDLASAILVTCLKHSSCTPPSSCSGRLAHARHRIVTILCVLARAPTLVRTALVLMPWIRPRHVCLDLYVLGHLARVRPNDNIDEAEWIDAVRVAASAGRVDVLSWLVGRVGPVGRTLVAEAAMLAACAAGYLAVLAWVAPLSPTTHVTSKAIVNAIQGGHIDVLNSLVAHLTARTHLLDKSAITSAAIHSSNPPLFLDWLTRHHLLTYDTQTLTAACTSGSLPLIDRHPPSIDTAGAYVSAARAGHVHVLSHLLYSRSLTILDAERVFAAAARAGQVHVLDWLVACQDVRPAAAHASTIMIMASRARHVRVLEWMRAHNLIHLSASAPDALVGAAGEGSVHVLEWWVAQVKGGRVRGLVGWGVVERMVKRACGGGSVEALAWVGGQVGESRVVGWVGEVVVMEGGGVGVEVLEWWWDRRGKCDEVLERAKVERAIQLAERRGGWDGFEVGYWWRQRLAELRGGNEEETVRMEAGVKQVEVLQALQSESEYGKKGKKGK